MFRSYSDHLQGARMFLVKVADCKMLCCRITTLTFTF